MLRDCLTGAVCAAVAKEAPDLDTACSLLVNGFAVLVIQGADRAVAFEVKSGEKRTPSPPSVEHTVQGAKDAFTETNRSNTNLLRRHLRSPLLRFREFPVGSKSHTNVTVVWLEGTTPPHLVRRLERRLRGLTVESFVTPAAVEEAVGGSRDTPFPLLRFTERPDKFAQALLDGQVGLFVDGLPLGYLAPVDLASFLTSPVDQAVDFVTASCIRVIRYAALLASLLLPGLYVAMAVFHQEMLPTKLLLSIIESKQQVPFPTLWEVLGLLLAFEILQEAGAHLPQSLGQAVSIIGGPGGGHGGGGGQDHLPGGADRRGRGGNLRLCDTGPGSGQRRPRVAVCLGGLRRSGRAVRTHRRAHRPAAPSGRPGDLRPGLSAPLRPGRHRRRGPPPQNPLRSPAPRQGPQRLAMRGDKRPLHTPGLCGKPSVR